MERLRFHVKQNPGHDSAPILRREEGADIDLGWSFLPPRPEELQSLHRDLGFYDRVAIMKLGAADLTPALLGSEIAERLHS